MFSAFCLLFSLSALAQSLDAQQAQERFLGGLVELRLPEVLQRYIETHPPSDAVEEAMYRLAARQIDLADPTLPSRERAAKLDEALRARADLIAAGAGDSRRPIWLAQQASDLFYELLAIDASGLTALFGLPTQAQRARAQRAAYEMNEVAAQAEESVAQAGLDLQAARGLADDSALEAQQRRRQLIERERDRRIPFFRGIASFLHAELNVRNDRERKLLYQLAADTLPSLAEALDGGPKIQAKLFGGLALARLGSFDSAEALFAAVAQDSQTDASDAFAARMGGVINRVMRGGPQSGLNALDSIEPRYSGADGAAIFFRVLIADQRFLLRLQLAHGAAAEKRGQIAAHALAAYTDLLAADFTASPPPTGDATVPRETLRAIVYARLVEASRQLDAAAQPARSPPDDGSVSAIVTIARADELSRHAATREQAIVTLESVLRRVGLAGQDRAAALFALGKALYDHGESLMASQRFIELAEQYSTDMQAERAVELGVSLADELRQRQPADAFVAETFRHGLELLLARYVNLPTIDHWRYAAGKLALDEGRFTEAAAYFEQVTAASDQWLDAQFMQALTAARNSRRTNSGDTFQIALAQFDQAEQLITTWGGGEMRSAAERRRKSDVRYYLASLRVLRGEVLLAMNRAQDALGAIEGIENDRSLDASVIGEALRIRIHAYQALKRPEEALRDIEKIIKAAPERLGGVGGVGGVGASIGESRRWEALDVVIAPMLMAMQRDVQALIESNRDDEATALAQRTLLPVARLLDGEALGAEFSADDFAPTVNSEQSADRRNQNSELADRAIIPGRELDAEGRPSVTLGLQIADSYRLAGDFQSALRWYERMLRDNADAAELLVGKAECLFNIGEEQRLAEAMLLYKRLAAAGPDAGRDRYWLSQLRMLQIIDRVDRHAEQILPKIERLRQQDASFGGERFRRGFETLRNKRMARL